MNRRFLKDIWETLNRVLKYSVTRMIKYETHARKVLLQNMSDQVSISLICFDKAK